MTGDTIYTDTLNERVGWFSLVSLVGVIIGFSGFLPIAASLAFPSTIYPMVPSVSTLGNNSAGFSPLIVLPFLNAILGLALGMVALHFLYDAFKQLSSLGGEEEARKRMKLGGKLVRYAIAYSVVVFFFLGIYSYSYCRETCSWEYGSAAGFWTFTVLLAFIGAFGTILSGVTKGLQVAGKRLGSTVITRSATFYWIWPFSLPALVVLDMTSQQNIGAQGGIASLYAVYALSIAAAVAPLLTLIGAIKADRKLSTAPLRIRHARRYLKLFIILIAAALLDAGAVTAYSLPPAQAPSSNVSFGPSTLILTPSQPHLVESYSSHAFTVPYSTPYAMLTGNFTVRDGIAQLYVLTDPQYQYFVSSYSLPTSGLPFYSGNQSFGTLDLRVPPGNIYHILLLNPLKTFTTVTYYFTITYPGSNLRPAENASQTQGALIHPTVVLNLTATGAPDQAFGAICGPTAPPKYYGYVRFSDSAMKGVKFFWIDFSYQGRETGTLSFPPGECGIGAGQTQTVWLTGLKETPKRGGQLGGVAYVYFENSTDYYNLYAYVPFYGYFG